MILTSALSALLDANVLYPAPLRDFLLRIAATGLYKPHWTDAIQDEWIRNLILKRNDIIKSNLEGTKKAMNNAFPDANVTGYDDIVDRLSLPDKQDRHVLAAAIKAKLNIIVTNNLKDFPVDYIRSFNVETQSPDVFICNLIDLNRSAIVQALKNQVKSLNNPPKTMEEVLSILKKCGLSKAVTKL